MIWIEINHHAGNKFHNVCSNTSASILQISILTMYLHKNNTLISTFHSLLLFLSNHICIKPILYHVNPNKIKWVKSAIFLTVHFEPIPNIKSMLVSLPNAYPHSLDLKSSRYENKVFHTYLKVWVVLLIIQTW